MYECFTCRLSLTVALAAAVVLGPASATLAQTARGPQRTGQVGAPVDVTGVLTVLYSDDFAHRRSDLTYNIREERSGRTFRLRFEGNAPRNLRSGTKLRVRGQAQGSEIYLRAEIAGQVTTVQQPTMDAAPAVVSGDQKTLVIVANLTDASVPSTVAQINDQMFASPLNKSVDDLYQEMSGGQVSFSGTVVGPYRLNRASTDPCDLNAISTEADAAAASAVDVKAYPRKVYVLPPAGCGGAGIAEFAITPSRAWVFFSDITDIYAHELGHNLGMHHAATPDNEYGDNTEIMGLARNRLRPLNAAHKFQMGWVTGSQVAVANQDGQYDLAPLELPAGASSLPQVLRVPKPDSADYYYLGYRRAIGFGTEVYPEYLDRINVHLWSGNAGRTYFLAALADGETFTDPLTGFTVTQVSHTDVAATAHVHPGAGCGTAPPSLTLTPPDVSGPAGTAATYDVSVVNNDAPSCTAAMFQLQSSVPAGWSGSLSVGALQLAPGAGGHTTLTVTAPLGTAQGTYSVRVSSTDANISAHAASASGSYAVSSSCIRGIPALSFSPASQTGAAGTTLAYNMAVTNRDTAGCPASTFQADVSVPAGWSDAISSPALSLPPGASGTVTSRVTSPSAAATGAYGISGRVSDGATSSHAQTVAASYLVQTTDSTPPSAPTSLAASVRRKQVTLTWTASSDNVGVTGYRVTRNGVVVSLTVNLNWTDAAPPAGVNTYAVAAYDAAGNVSLASSSVSVNLTGGRK